MLAQERHDQILWLINSEGTVKTSDLIKRFNVSLETIRRDLESLEKAGKLKRVYGGAIQKNPSRKFKNFNTREKEFSKEKIRIAEKALDIIEDGQAIALDSGTTNLILAKMLKGRFKHLTIVTNSMIIAIYNVEFFSIFIYYNISGIIKFIIHQIREFDSIHFKHSY